MRLRLKRDQVLIRKDQHDCDERGMIVTGGVVHRAPPIQSGTVVAVGPGLRTSKGYLIPPDCAPGDRVQFEDARGTEIDVPGHGRHLFIREKFVLFAC